MNNQSELDLLKEEIAKIKPKKSFNKVPDEECGINFVIKYLSENNNEAYTNELAKEMHASTARVSSLINKLEERGLVKRLVSSEDARKTKLVLTNEGIKCRERLMNDVDRYLSKLIERIGMEKLMTCISVVKEMEAIASEERKEKVNV